MSITHYKRLVRFLNTCMGYLITVPVLLLLLTYLDVASLSWAMVFPLATCLLSFALREYVSNFLLFTAGNLLCLAMPAGMWFLTDGLVATSSNAGTADLLDLAGIRLIVTLIYGIYALAQIILTFVLRLRHKEEHLAHNLPLPWLVIPVLIQILCLSADMDTPIPWILVSALLVILIRFANDYIINYIAFLEEVRDASEVPMGQISSTSSWLLALFFTLASLLMTLSCFLPLNHLLPVVGNYLLTGIKFLLRLIGRLFGNHREDAGAFEPESTEPNLSGLAPAGGETSPFWELMEKVIMVVLLAGAVIGGIALLLYAILQLVKAFYNRTALQTDKVEFLNPFDRAEKLERTQTTDSFWERVFGTSPEQRIRKFWYRTIRHRVPSASAPMTPTELVDHMTRDQEEQAQAAELNLFYEQARYSNHPSTKEDAAAAKQLAASLKNAKSSIADSPLLRNRQP